MLEPVVEELQGVLGIAVHDMLRRVGNIGRQDCDYSPLGVEYFRRRWLRLHDTDSLQEKQGMAKGYRRRASAAPDRWTFTLEFIAPRDPHERAGRCTL